jgi:hypothetical protein
MDGATAAVLLLLAAVVVADKDDSFFSSSKNRFLETALSDGWFNDVATLFTFDDVEP